MIDERGLDGWQAGQAGLSFARPMISLINLRFQLAVVAQQVQGQYNKHGQHKDPGNPGILGIDCFFLPGLDLLRKQVDEDVF